ncbi:class II aldolase/adducin family protein [Microbacterium pygmaeum]|uniref:HCOMODA/2-hydroxy-3-carboxy-muconic semialdehyde decarboxylase n=1 Tax=Microbacterium pygmaeum TaxID=370764 RepID=A0A1G7W9B7_9MICO|nr:class II aldolase/adducin family protein [Microbacterium pygmaeum]SDG68553.1 HCOMODA/2-hydroxy-3-carboxy-muconic semialdehyde decarboxylase [Microbacterium pygmaeum]
MRTTTTASQLIDDLVDANHVLVDRGVLDAYGHVSGRHPDDPEKFLIARNLAPGLVTAADIQVLDLDGGTDDERPSYLERFIHGEIYRARPDVHSVVHSHSASVIPFTISNRPLQAVWHMAGFLGEGVPVYEIREDAGMGSDLLVRTPELGAGLAASLGEGAVALMRGHGSVTVGDSIPHAVWRAVFAELNARALAVAVGLGEVTPLTAEEGIAAAKSNYGQIRRPWELWRAEARAGRRG